MPDAPQVYRVYSSVEEAEQWAQSLGVMVDYDARLDLANFANELLWQLQQRALMLPDEMRVDKQVFRPLGLMGFQTPASTNKGSISINPDASVWRDPIKIALQQRAQKSWSSDHPLHPLFHEAGHALIYKANPSGFTMLHGLTNAQKTIISGEVSFRACLDSYEFTAEVFAGLIANRKFSKDIVRWYKARGGVKV